MNMPATIEAVMRAEGPLLTPATPIREAAAALASATASGAPVVDDTGALVGILTQKDCFRAALNASYYRQWTGTVGDVMSATLTTLDAGTDIVTAGEAFLVHPHRLFPVLKDGKLVGVLHRSDLLAALLRLG